jgi:hypothetical protein
VSSDNDQKHLIYVHLSGDGDEDDEVIFTKFFLFVELIQVDFNYRIIILILILLSMFLVFIIYIHLVNRDNILLNRIFLRVQQRYKFIRRLLFEVKVRFYLKKTNYSYVYLNRETSSRTSIN